MSKKLRIIVEQIYMTCSIWLASKAVPGRRITGLDTCPDSTHTIFGYSSSPKSDISFAWSIHGFQITVSGKLYFWMRILRPDTTFVMMCSCGVFWYILSVHSFMVTTSLPSWYIAPSRVLSINVQPCKPVIWHRLTSGTLKYVCSSRLKLNVKSLLGLYVAMLKCNSFSRRISLYVTRNLKKNNTNSFKKSTIQNSAQFHQHNMFRLWQHNQISKQFICHIVFVCKDF